MCILNCMCMCVHGHVHVCTCACACVYKGMCMCVHAHVHVCTCACACVQGHVHVCTCACACVYKGMCMCVHGHVHVCTCPCACVYISIPTLEAYYCYVGLIYMPMHVLRSDFSKHVCMYRATFHTDSFSYTLTCTVCILQAYCYYVRTSKSTKKDFRAILSAKIPILPFCFTLPLLVLYSIVSHLRMYVFSSVLSAHMYCMYVQLSTQIHASLHSHVCITHTYCLV